MNPNHWDNLRPNHIAFNTEGGLELWGQNALVSNNVIESNGGFGIAIYGGSGSVLTGNTIRSNQGPGIAVVAGQGHNIGANSIYNNTGLGIDLGNNGVTLNDAGDADAGPNNLQNYPVLTSVVAAGGQTYVQGSIDSTTTASAYPITLRFYGNAAPDLSGYGEGETFLGSITMTGPGPFSTYLPAANFIAAAATDANGNTSEFSPCYAVAPDLPATIGNFVWLDANGNGIQDGGETGLGGVLVQLFDVAGQLVASTVTNGSGFYQFTGIAAGSYYLLFQKPPGYAFTLQDQGSDLADSDVNAAGITALFALGGGQVKDDLDAGLINE